MPNSYTQLYIQFVFAVKYRRAQISSSWEEKLYKYISGIVNAHGHKLICINGMPDHIHILIKYHTTQSIADLIRIIKSNSSKWINENKISLWRFEWQRGYGAFSYSKSHLNNVIKYINNQKNHHKNKKFLDEYLLFLEKFEVDYNPEFIFNELE